MCRGEKGRKRALHPGAAHSYGSQLGTRVHRRYQVPVLFNDSFGIWEDFMQHCDVVETHLMRASFCDHRGDFFARSGSLERHCKRPPSHSFARSLLYNHVHGDREVMHWEQVGSFPS